MKKPFLGLLLLAAWLTSFAANATTYTYDVDYSFTTTGGDVTGFITTSCDNCILTASNILSWKKQDRDWEGCDENDWKQIALVGWD